MGVTKKVQDAKAWWKSKTIIGTILMIMPMLIKIISPEAEINVGDAINTAWKGAEGLAVYADSTWAQLQEVLGFILAIYGRIKAEVGIKKAI